MDNLKKILLFTILLSFAFSGFAREQTYYARSPRALLMGDAYTALADDGYTLFYNPAALARHRGLTMSIMNMQLDVTNPLEHDEILDTPNTDEPAEFAKQYLAVPIHLGLGYVPGLKFGTFGLNGLASVNTNLEVLNAHHPLLDIDYRFDKGFATGFAVPIFGSRPPAGNRNPGAGNYGALGFGLKYISREGLQKRMPVFGTDILDIMNEQPETIDELKDAIGYGKGKSWAYDLGFLYHAYASGTNLTVGLSAMDIGGTYFDRVSGEEQIQPQPMHINAGIAFEQNFGLFNYTLSADFAPMNQPIALANKIKLGARFGIPLIDLYMGLNGGYLSYGASLDLYMFKLYAGFYGIETTSEMFTHASKRAMIYLTLLDISFPGL